MRHKTNPRWLAYIALLGCCAALLLGCASTRTPPAAASSQQANLEFEVRVQAGSGERETLIDLGVRNQGGQDVSDKTFGARMELRDSDGELRASAETVSLDRLPAGEMQWIVQWQGKLDPGAYHLAWGAPGYSSTEVDFVVERSGQLSAGEDSADDSPSSQSLVERAKVDLGQQLGIPTQEIVVQSIEEAEFPDASLGVPQPGQMYAQIVTPGYVIVLSVPESGSAGRSTYSYHAGGDRVVQVPGAVAPTPPAPTPPQSPALLSIQGVRVDGRQVVVHGHGTLPDGACVYTQLLAKGEPQTWWPTETCAIVQDKAWQIEVAALPEPLSREAQYMVRAWLRDDPSVETAFPFDLAGPPAYERIEISSVGLAFDIPAGWSRREPEWVWSPEPKGALQIGVNWVDLQPPAEAEPALLPNHAQTLSSVPVELAWGQGRQFTVEVYAPAAQGSDAKAPVESVEIHTVVVLANQEARRAFDLYARAPTAGELEALRPALNHMLSFSVLAQAAVPAQPSAGNTLPLDPQRTAGWQTFRDEEHGFAISFPADWTFEELDAQGPGTPSDWPVKRIVTFFPQDWADELKRSGPPDPTKLSLVAPLHLEVCVGSQDQYRRAYPPPTTSEVVQIGTAQGEPLVITREIDALSESIQQIRYVALVPAESPTAPGQEVRIVFSDLLTGFPDRTAAHPDLVELVPLIVSTLSFIGG